MSASPIAPRSSEHANLDQKTNSLAGEKQRLGTTTKGADTLVRVRSLIDSNMAGCLIGWQGQTIQCIRQCLSEHGPVEISVSRADLEESKDLRVVTIIGKPAIVAQALLHISFVLLGHTRRGDKNSNSQMHHHRPHTIRVLLPSAIVGCVIGHHGSVANALRLAFFSTSSIYESLFIESNPFRGSNDRLLTMISHNHDQLFTAMNVIFEAIADKMQERNIAPLAYFAGEYRSEKKRKNPKGTVAEPPQMKSDMARGKESTPNVICRAVLTEGRMMDKMLDIHKETLIKHCLDQKITIQWADATSLHDRTSMRLIYVYGYTIDSVDLLQGIVVRLLQS